MTIQDLFTNTDITPLVHIGKAVAYGWIIGQLIVGIIVLVIIFSVIRRMNQDFKRF